jgi:DnaJ like chaperone protein
MAKGQYDWLIGAGLGFAFMGPLGAIFGGIVGSQIGKRRKGGRPFFPGTGAAGPQAAGRDTRHYTGGGEEGDLILSFLVLAAAITKADQQVSSSEIKVLKEFVVRSFGTTRAAALMKMYKEILEKPIDLDAVCGQIREVADDRFKRTVVQILYEIAMADQDLARAEAEAINTVAAKIGLSEAEHRAIAALYNQKAPDRDFGILELSPGATDEDIKSKYRELVKKYHPDKVAHLGKEFRDLAEKKFKEISAAYNRIKEKRGL